MKKFLIKRKSDLSSQKHGYTTKKLWGKMIGALNCIKLHLPYNNRILLFEITIVGCSGAGGGEGGRGANTY